jgi:hypothetical protein
MSGRLITAAEALQQGSQLEEYDEIFQPLLGAASP